MREKPVRLPSLDYLRSFVIVGRHLSISKAADEMCLTQSAVSRQVLSLERSLGIALFERRHRAIVFTREGEKLFRTAEAMIDTVCRAVDSMRGHAGRTTVTITASSGVSALWLLPRLGRLHELDPRIDLRVVASNRMLNMSQEEADLALRYCLVSESPARAIHLFGEHLCPVAHPSMRNADIESVQGLSRLILLEYEGAGHAHLRWDQWLQTDGLSTTDARGVLRFNRYEQVVAAAQAGQGIAIGRFPLMNEIVGRDNLALVGTAMREAYPQRHYCVLASPQAVAAPVEAVIRWIQSEGTSDIQGAVGNCI